MLAGPLQTAHGKGLFYSLRASWHDRQSANRLTSPHRCRDQTGLDAINNSFLAWVAYKLGSFVPISTLKIYIFRSKIQEDYSSYSRWGIKGEPVGRVSKCHQYTRKSSHGSHVPGLLGNHYKINLLVMNVSTFRSIRAETIGMNKSYHLKNKQTKSQEIRQAGFPVQDTETAYFIIIWFNWFGEPIYWFCFPIIRTEVSVPYFNKQNVSLERIQGGGGGGGSI